MGDGLSSTRLARGIVRTGLAMAVALTALACQSSPTSAPADTAASSEAATASGAEPTGANGSSSGPGTEGARAAIQAANLGDPDSISAVSAIRFSDEGAAAAAAAIQSGATGDALWAATWVYGAAGTDPNILLQLLSSQDATIRALAAAPLVAWGRREAADELVRLLSTGGVLHGSAPLITIAAFADSTLQRFIHGPAIAADASAADRASAWSSWLAPNGAAMQFDADSGTWSIP